LLQRSQKNQEMQKRVNGLFNKAIYPLVNLVD